MRNDILERKIARIILAIAQELGVSEEKAISVFYATETYKQLVDPRYGLQLMSDGYILEEFKGNSVGSGVSMGFAPIDTGFNGPSASST